MGLRVDWEGKLGVYLPEGSYVGNAKGLFENDLLVSRKRWLILAACIFSSTTLTGHKQVDKAMLETLMK